MKKELVIVVLSLVMGVGAGSAIDLDQPPAKLATPHQVLDLQLQEVCDADDWRRMAEQRGFRTRGGAVQVVVDTHKTAAVSRWLEERGAQHLLVVEGRVQAWVPRWALEDLAELTEVRWIGRPDYASVGPVNPPLDLEAKAGTITSQGVRASNASSWHAAGFMGDGVKVAIIDGGFEDYESLLGTDLPSADSVHFQSFGGSTNSGSGNHGTGCAEVVHDMAPGAELYFALVSTNVDIDRAIDWVVSNGVHAATMSLGFFNISPGDGTGSLQRSIAFAVQQSDLFFATSAGNAREGHWQGQTTDADGDGWVEFDLDEEVNAYSGTLNAGTVISLHLVWNDWDVTDQDYSLHLMRIEDDGSTTEVSAADRIQSGGSFQRPVEDLNYSVPTSGRYGFAVFRKSVTQDNDMEAFDADLRFEISVDEGSLTLPADTREVMAVAAAAHSGSHDYRSFSSAGPANGPGGSLEGGHAKVDIAGYDGVSTVTLGTFFGTSAASPHVGGAAAVVRHAFPEYSESETRMFLEQHAIDKGPVGHDVDYGWGRLSLGAVPGMSCAFDVSPESGVFGPETSGGLIIVTTEDICFWTATSREPWITLQTDANTGTGVVVYRVEENTGFSERQGVIDVAEHEFVVTQQGKSCSFVLSPTSAEFAAAGGDGRIAVNVETDCRWTATSGADWVSLTDGAEGDGPGEVEYRVAANDDENERTAQIEIGDVVFTVVQDGYEPSLPWKSVVGGIADSSGAQGTRWASDLALLNLSDSDTEVAMTYRHGNAEVLRRATVSAGEILEWRRVPVVLFGVEENSSGAVEISAERALTVTARTYNDAETGTFGQYLPGVELSDTLVPGGTAVLAPLASNDQFRVNVGFVNPGDDDLVGRVQVFGSDGGARGTQVSIAVPAGSWAQQNRLFDAAGAGSCDECYAVVDVDSGGGGLWAYASVVDNGSGDPTTLPHVPLGVTKNDRRWLVAGMADVDGLNDTRWKSTLAVVNHGAATLDVALTYRSGGGEVGVPISFSGNGIQLWNNVVSELFERPATVGAVEVISGGAPVTAARTYNDSTLGTFGQYLPAVEEAQAIVQGELGVLSQIKSTGDFRSNIGFVNFGETTCDVTIRLFDDNGVGKGQPVVSTIPAGGWLQENKVFETSGAGACELGYAIVEVDSPACAVWAYASVVDNGSGDPTNIPMALAE